MTGYFIEGSTATGALIAILITSEIYFHSITREQNQVHVVGNISSAVDGITISLCLRKYMHKFVSVYDMLHPWLAYIRI